VADNRVDSEIMVCQHAAGSISVEWPLPSFGVVQAGQLVKVVHGRDVGHGARLGMSDEAIRRNR